ncbi:MAG: heme A synthase [Acidimicrobiia bacterium]
MRRISLSPTAYRRITLVAAILLGIIIVTGGAVRLTNSGLGCPSWPNCEAGSLTPRSASDYNAMVEFLNRTFTGLVSVAVIVAVLGSLVRVPRRKDLVWLSVGLVAGVVAQAVLGGLTVLFELKPGFVMAHFLVSIVLLTDAIVLYARAGIPDDVMTEPSVRAVSDRVVALARSLLVLASLVLVTGTVVTGAGPHSGGGRGDEITRIDIPIPDAARVHGTTVMAFLGVVILTVLVAWHDRAPERLKHRLTVLLVVLVAQTGVGYTQYFTNVPPLLVGIHVAGATLVWTAAVWCYLGCFERRALRTSEQTSPPVLATA